MSTPRMDAPTLWYEDEQGGRWIPPPNFPTPEQFAAPPGFIYQRSRFPRELHETVLRCNGDGTSTVILRGSTSWPYDLVLALTRPTLREWAMAILRYGSPGPRLSMEQAILRAAGCERCINTLAHRCGLTWGYRAGGPEDRSRTFCEHCKINP